MTYRVHDTVPPDLHKPIWADEKTAKLANRDVLKWANDAPPPPIGTEIWVTMNRIGPARVKGYFEQDNWFGLLVELLDPPDWHKRQNKGDTTGHIFGPEFRLTKEKAK